MRARNPEDPDVQDRSLGLMKMYIWIAVAVALVAAVACGFMGGLGSFTGAGGAAETNTDGR